MESKKYTISLDAEYNEKWELIAKRNYSDKSKMLRKWIDENFREEYRNE